jgi:acylphosphatase
MLLRYAVIDSQSGAVVILQVIIRGRVQGVGYRAWAEHAAARHGLDGWVRNRRDGTVEAVFAGPAAAVEAMVEACRLGPHGARIDAIDCRGADATVLAQRRADERFSVLPTL